MIDPAPVRPPTVALVAIARPTFDVPLAQSVATATAAAIESAGFVLAGSGSALIMDADGIAVAQAQLEAAPFDLLVLLQASFADSTMAVHLAGVAHARSVPVLLWAVPDVRDGGRLRLNSLCGINLAGHALTMAGIRYDYVLAPVGDTAALRKVGMLARTGRALQALRTATIGVAGEHPAGFETCQYDAGALQGLFGVKIAPLDLFSLLASARNADQGARQEFLQRVRGHAANLDELDAAAASGTAGVYVALRQQVEEGQLSAVAVRCWPEFFTELGCAACGAMSVLNEDHCPASCEADVNGTLTSLLLQNLGASQAFIADLVSIEPGSDAGGSGVADTGVFWHCGLAPFAMADPGAGVRGTVHSNRKLPLLFEFPLKPGRITIARLHRTGTGTGSGGYQLALGGGEMLAAPRPYGGTCGVVRFDLPAAEVLDRVMRHGLEHHFSIIYGDYRAELAAFAAFARIPALALTALEQTQ
jgi:L-fucose isomerase-like protein